jgi:hypothetical protein
MLDFMAKAILYAPVCPGICPDPLQWPRSPNQKAAICGRARENPDCSSLARIGYRAPLSRNMIKKT